MRLLFNVNVKICKCIQFYLYSENKTKQKKTGYKISALSALTNNANVANSVPATTLAPVHRVVPSVVDLNNAQSEIPPVPTNAYGLPPAGPIASSYGVPNES